MIVIVIYKQESCTGTRDQVAMIVDSRIAMFKTGAALRDLETALQRTSHQTRLVGTAGLCAELIVRLSQLNIAVKWVWVKGHAEVQGNEAADSGATRGKQGEEQAMQPQTVIRAHDDQRRRQMEPMTKAAAALKELQADAEHARQHPDEDQVGTAEEYERWIKRDQDRLEELKTAWERRRESEQAVLEQSRIAIREATIRCRQIDARTRLAIARAKERQAEHNDESDETEKTCNEEKAKNDTNEEEDQETQEDSQETTVGDSQQTVVEEENNDDDKSQTGGEERGQQHQPTNGLRLKNKRRRENAKKRKRGENASAEQRKEAENNGEREQQRREASRAKRRADWDKARLEAHQKAEKIMLEKKTWKTPLAHRPGMMTIDVHTQNHIPAQTETDRPIHRSWFNDTLIDAYANLVMIKQRTTPVVGGWEDRVMATATATKIQEYYNKDWNADKSGQKTVRLQLQKLRNDSKTTKARTVYLPAHDGYAHWTLVAVRTRTGQVTVHDSLGRHQTELAKNIHTTMVDRRSSDSRR